MCIRDSTYTATIKYSVNANYTFDISYSDLASHPADNYKQDKFTVDEYAPSTSKMKISYSKELNFWESVLNGITFGYYAYQKDVTVTLTAVDDISGVESMTWTYTRETVSYTHLYNLSGNNRLCCTRAIWWNGTDRCKNRYLLSWRNSLSSCYWNESLRTAL